jgi:hypothetical protein
MATEGYVPFPISDDPRNWKFSTPLFQKKLTQDFVPAVTVYIVIRILLLCVDVGVICNVHVVVAITEAYLSDPMELV